MQGHKCYGSSITEYIDDSTFPKTSVIILLGFIDFPEGWKAKLTTTEVGTFEKVKRKKRWIIKRIHERKFQYLHLTEWKATLGFGSKLAPSLSSTTLLSSAMTRQAKVEKDHAKIEKLFTTKTGTNRTNVIYRKR